MTWWSCAPLHVVTCAFEYPISVLICFIVCDQFKGQFLINWLSRGPRQKSKKFEKFPKTNIFGTKKTENSEILNSSRRIEVQNWTAWIKKKGTSTFPDSLKKRKDPQPYRLLERYKWRRHTEIQYPKKSLHSRVKEMDQRSSVVESQKKLSRQWRRWRRCNSWWCSRYAEGVPCGAISIWIWIWVLAKCLRTHSFLSSNWADQWAVSCDIHEY